MYALTVKQPWAEAIARHGKNVENRTRRPPAHLLGERIAIHVGQASDDWTWMRDGTEPFHDHRHDLYLWAQHGFEHTSDRVPSAGRIIATARLVAWFRHTPGERRPGGTIPGRDWEVVDGFTNGDCLRAVDSPWLTGPVAWVLADVRRLAWPVSTWATCKTCHGLKFDASSSHTCRACDGSGKLDIPIRGQVYPFQLSPEVEAAVLAAEVAP